MTVLFVAFAMIVSGAVEILGRRLMRLAAIGQIVMILCFVTLLHRAYPEIFLLDGLYVLVLSYLLLCLSPAAVHA